MGPNDYHFQETMEACSGSRQIPNLHVCKDLRVLVAFGGAMNHTPSTSTNSLMSMLSQYPLPVSSMCRT